jgi:hypothetical protein
MTKSVIGVSMLEMQVRVTQKDCIISHSNCIVIRGLRLMN